MFTSGFYSMSVVNQLKISNFAAKKSGSVEKVLSWFERLLTGISR